MRKANFSMLLAGGMSVGVALIMSLDGSAVCLAFQVNNAISTPKSLHGRSKSSIKASSFPTCARRQWIGSTCLRMLPIKDSSSDNADDSSSSTSLEISPQKTTKTTTNNKLDQQEDNTTEKENNKGMFPDFFSMFRWKKEPQNQIDKQQTKTQDPQLEQQQQQQEATAEEFTATDTNFQQKEEQQDEESESSLPVSPKTEETQQQQEEECNEKEVKEENKKVVFPWKTATLTRASPKTKTLTATWRSRDKPQRVLAPQQQTSMRSQRRVDAKKRFAISQRASRASATTSSQTNDTRHTIARVVKTPIVKNQTRVVDEKSAPDLSYRKQLFSLPLSKQTEILLDSPVGSLGPENYKDSSTLICKWMERRASMSFLLQTKRKEKLYTKYLLNPIVNMTHPILLRKIQEAKYLYANSNTTSKVDTNGNTIKVLTYLDFRHFFSYCGIVLSQANKIREVLKDNKIQIDEAELEVTLDLLDSIANQVRITLFDTLKLMHQTSIDLNDRSLAPSSILARIVSSGLMRYRPVNLTTVFELFQWRHDLASSGDGYQGLTLQAALFHKLIGVIVFFDGTHVNTGQENKQQVLDFLRFMQELGVHDDGSFSHLYLKAFRPFLVEKTKEGAEVVTKLLKEFRTAFMDKIPTSSLPPNKQEERLNGYKRMFMSAFEAWVYGGLSKWGDLVPQRCEELLEMAKQDPYLDDFEFAFKETMRAWARSDSPGALERVEELMKDMVANHKFIPSSMCYRAYIEALTRAADSPDTPGAVTYLTKAERCLEAMLKNGKHEQEEKTKGPLAVALSFSLVIESWAKLPERSMILHAVELFKLQVKGHHVHGAEVPPPNASSFSSLIGALRTLPDGIELIEELLAFIESSERVSLVDLLDGIACTQFLSSLFADLTVERLQLAEQLVELVGETRKRDGKAKARRFKVPMHLAVKSHRQLISLYRYIKVDSHDEYAAKAEATWDRMQQVEQYHEKVSNENKKLMNDNIVQGADHVANIWAKSESSNAPTLTRQFVEKAQKALDGNPFLDVDSMNSLVIVAISNGKEKDMAERGLAELRRLQELHEQGHLATPPGAASYAAVLRCCCAVLSFLEEDDDEDEVIRQGAFEIATQIYREMITARSKRTSRLNPLFYEYFFKATRFMPRDYKDKYDMIKKAFGKCKRDGHVLPSTIHFLRSSVPPYMARELTEALMEDVLGSKHIQLDDIPEEWTRNTD